MSLVHLILLASVLVVAEVAYSCDFSWELYKNRHGKDYEANQDEDSMRKANFMRNCREIGQHNSFENSSFTMGLSHLSDWTQEELAMLDSGPQNYATNADQIIEPPADNNNPLLFHTVEGQLVPDELDWRTFANRVGPVKDQGKCGSGWAFATTGVLEGQQQQQWARSKSRLKLIPLSEQNLLDCSRSNSGCKGGSVADALSDIASEGGIQSEKLYPYRGKKNRCKFDAEKSLITVSGFTYLGRNATEIKRTVARFGPVAAEIRVSMQALSKYKTGIYSHEVSPDALHDGHDLNNHAVLIVGYGTDPKHGDYWILKNSWGKDWGENGYFRTSRNLKETCGLDLAATIPVFSSD